MTVEKRESIKPCRLTTTKTRDFFGVAPRRVHYAVKFASRHSDT